jgi:hypothetical protein
MEEGGKGQWQLWHKRDGMDWHLKGKGKHPRRHGLLEFKEKMDKFAGEFDKE